MSSNDTVRNRLNSLKNITQQLKNSTTSGPINFTHIKSLIGNLKHISQIPGQSIVKSDENQTYPFAVTQPSRQAISEKAYEEEEYRPLFQQMKKKQPQSYLKTLQESEIIDLRQQNLKLQQKLLALKEELQKLKQKSQQISQQKDYNKLPYFSLKEITQAFVCRYEILEQNYQKIEYTEYQLQLKLDRIVLLRRQKKSVQEFDLSTLKIVRYIDSCHILLRFQQFVESQMFNEDKNANQNSKDLTNLFLKFQSEQQLHKWDLSFFINYNIVNSLHEKRLFQPYFRRLSEQKHILRQKNNITEIRQSKQLDEKKQKDLLKILIKKRQDYLQIRTLIQQKLGNNKIEHQNLEENDKNQKEKTAQRHPDIPEPISLVSRPDRISFSSSNTKSRKKNPSKNWQETQYNSMSPSIIEKIGQVEPNLQVSHHQNSGRMNFSPSFSGLGTNQHKVQGRPESQTYPIASFTHQNQASSFKPFPSNASSPRMNQIINQSKMNSSQWPDNKLSTISKSKQNQMRVIAARQNLQKGYHATKYSKDGFSPHEKKIFLSLDCKKLCWSDKDKESDYKGIPLQVVTKIQYATIGEGIKKHVKRPEPKYYCLIQYFTGEYKKKTIELGSGNYDQIKKFTEQLQLAVNSQRGIPLATKNDP